jgi:pseudaminic acid synthase
MHTIQIANRSIGGGHPTYIIAELSANHNQNFDEAVRLIHAAKAAGADAVKLQTYTPDTITINANSAYFQIRGTLWDGRTLYDLYKEAYTPWEWQPKLKLVANDLGMALFSTPFDGSAVDFLESIQVPAYKIASFENGDLGLLRQIARTGKPIIMSTGMATLAEIAEAVAAIREAGGQHLALLKCTSAYPALPEDANLRTIPHMAEGFNTPVGLSDHTLGVAVPIAAVTLGACIIEKHFTLSRQVPGPDSAFSLEPDEFKLMVDSVRMAEKALGNVVYEPSADEAKSRPLRRSLFVVKPIKAGEVITHNNVRSIRPGYGLHPRYLDLIIGKTARCDIEYGTPFTWDLLVSNDAQIIGTSE